MKKFKLLLTMLMLLLLTGIANAGLQIIGTATYMGSDYNLIYEDDSIDGGLVWLDYTNEYYTWQEQVSWASSLTGILTYNLNPGIDVIWDGDWRLPLTQDEVDGYNQNGSEMGHLYYDSLGNVAFFGLNNVGDFNNLQSSVYCSGTEYSPDPDYAGVFDFLDGEQDYYHKLYHSDALAVRPGQVSAAVPLPGAVWLLGSGLACFGLIRRKAGRRHLVIG